MSPNTIVARVCLSLIEDFMWLSVDIDHMASQAMSDDAAPDSDDPNSNYPIKNSSSQTPQAVIW